MKRKYIEAMVRNIVWSCLELFEVVSINKVKFFFQPPFYKGLKQRRIPFLFNNS
jgi:hypothetical protein